MKKRKEKPKTHPPTPRVGHPNWSFQFLPEPPAKILEVAFAGVDAVLVDSRPLAAFLPPGRLAL